MNDLTIRDPLNELDEAEQIIQLERELHIASNVIYLKPRRRSRRCPHCKGITKRFGTDRHRRQRWRCKVCKRTFAIGVVRLIDGVHTPDLKIQMLFHLVAEGISLRGAGRILRLAKHTIHKIHDTTGTYCRDFMQRVITGLPASDVEVDEVWTYVLKKQFNKTDLEKKNHEVGSQWIYLGIDRSSKLILAFHVGRRTVEDACEFMRKLRAATTGQMTVYTDGFQPYPTAVYAAFLYNNDLSALPDFLENPAVIVRNNGQAGLLHHTEAIDYTRSCTNQIERFNGTLRDGLKRLSRRTKCASKTKHGLLNGVSIFLAYYNFCRVHGALEGRTPAMAAGLTDKPWTVRELLLAAKPKVEPRSGNGVPQATLEDETNEAPPRILSATA